MKNEKLIKPNGRIQYALINEVNGEKQIEGELIDISKIKKEKKKKKK